MIPLTLPHGSGRSRPDVKIGATPGGKALKFQHRGAYDDVDSTPRRSAYLDEKGYDALNVFVEEYLNDPKGPEDTGLALDIYVFIKVTRVAFFDLDGTLTDPKLASAGRHTCLARNGPAGPAAGGTGMANRSADDREHAEAGGRAGGGGLRLYRQRYGETGLFENRVYDGIPELLQQLRDGDWRLMVATSKAEPYAIRIVEHFGLGGSSTASMARGRRVAHAQGRIAVLRAGGFARRTRRGDDRRPEIRRPGRWRQRIAHHRRAFGLWGRAELEEAGAARSSRRRARSRAFCP